MRVFAILATASFLALAPWADTHPALAADPTFLPGSRIGLVPPDGMVTSHGITGFNNPRTGDAIVALEMPPEAYPAIAASFASDALKQQGFVLKTRETVKVGTSDAILISGDQTAPGGRFIPKALLLGTAEDMTALVIAQAAPMAKSEGANLALLGALRSVAFRPPLPLDQQVAALPFKMSDMQGFRPVRVMAGSALLLTSGPNDAVAQVEQPVLIVARSSGQVPPPENRDAFARGAISSGTFLSDVVFERSQGFRQNGADWHEIVARAKDTRSGEPVVAMQTIRFAPGSYLRTVGVVKASDRDAVLPRFRKFVDGVAPLEPQ